MDHIEMGKLALWGGPHTILAETDPTLWYVTRTLGVVAYGMLTLSIIFGILRTTARRTDEPLPWVVDELHQFTALLAVFAVIGHMIALYYDPYLPFSLSNLLLPFAEPYKPNAMRIGVLAMYGMVALLLTSWLRQKINYQFWRLIHYVSFFAFVLVSLHGWEAGSDSGETWMRSLYGGAIATVAFLSAVRFFAGRGSESSIDPA
jgi:methionine sulfoxide reductase heme-binding subunit